jgi:hypothetical protein
MLTNQQVELLSKISFLERSNKKINTEKLHKCIPILTSLYKVIVRYQRKIKRDPKNKESNVAIIKTKPIESKDYCPLKIVNGIKFVKIEDKYKFQKFEYKSKELIELEKELDACEKELDGESTEYHSVYEKEIEEKARKYDELVKRREEKREKEKEEVKRKLKATKDRMERKKILKEYFQVAKCEVDKTKIDGFDFSISRQYEKEGLAGYLSVVTNSKYMKTTNLATKQIMRERMNEFESGLPQEEKDLLQHFRQKEKEEKVVQLVEKILEIKERNDQALVESRKKIQEEKERRQQNRQRFYMLGNRPFSEAEFDILDEKAKKRLEPYLRLITQRMAKYLVDTKYEEEEVSLWTKDKEMEEEFNARYS